LPNYQALRALPAAHHAQWWGRQSYYRAMSLINGGRQVEDDLFAGLRGQIQSRLLFHIADQPAAVF
jgi:hypothetical protein